MWTGTLQFHNTVGGEVRPRNMAVKSTFGWTEEMWQYDPHCLQQHLRQLRLSLGRQNERNPEQSSLPLTFTNWAQGSRQRQKVCGGDGWTPFTEKKCIKLFSVVGEQSHYWARKYCDDGTGSSRLVTLQSAAEQAAINTYLTRLEKNLSLAIPQYLWLDGSDVQYDQKLNSTYNSSAFNWEEPVKPNTTYLHLTFPTCIQMHAYFRTWSNENCSSPNAVFCTRPQHWSLEKVQEVVEALQGTGDIETLNKNPVPLGFIYVQLPKEKSPQEIWASAGLTWTDISASFNSTFFRVGNNENNFSNCSYVTQAKVPRGGGWSGDLYTVKKFKGLGEENGSISFHFSGGEVRPRNMAVKVWKRTG
ncbi:hypothetical protein TYRP_023440 [Tyrophagus putrescentiae]|nr:hypothetical protein TYRP_023440 [Tyrophagus putrescentiae]